MRLRSTALKIGLTLFLGSFGVVSVVLASASNGRIDPNNKGQHYAKFLQNPGIDVSVNDLRINFGKFDTQYDYNIRITDDGLTGYAWGALSGWVVMNCSDTASGCSPSNGNFKVDVDEEGILSGYAWGENAGWINFGPFTNTDISRVQIDDKGYFDGVSGAAGYAWSEQFGWIYFDCDAGNDTCVRTDYRPSTQRPGEGGVSGSVTQCGDNIDNDGDGKIDMTDPQCGNGSMSEFAPYSPALPQPLSPKPVYPSVPSPVVPNTPTVPIDTSVIDTPTFIPFPDDIPNIPDQSSRVPVGERPTSVGVPEVRDWLTDALRNIVQSVKSFFDMLTNAIKSAMEFGNGDYWTIRASVVGLVLMIVSVALIVFIVPAAAGADLALYPKYLWHNIKGMLGITPALSPWGVVYDATTFQPVGMATIALRDAAGMVVATTITEPNGTFSFKIPSGAYSMTLESAASGISLAQTTTALFGETYVPGTVVGVANNAPSHPYSIGVNAPAQPPLTKFQEWMVRHEVTITNTALALFGAGMLAAFLSLIFTPSVLTAAIFGGYVVVAVLRSVGTFGSYASVLLDKTTGAPLAGKLVQVYDPVTKSEVARTLSTRHGRAYVNLPQGHYYMVVTDPSAASLPGSGIPTPSFTAHGGLHRARFTL